ncbi:hypothetical protein SAMN02745213_01774 [Succinivibrio dextrinosolvens DSM 3072]|uniref:Uncharacterized protein n=1 Tax=Succinivibrio dextrinosolvens DSM 3072 TaxID=1123324 RepID=A0A1T4VMN5_9GAMM|nr:hypothetical protein [Succinivibrio dextrinosolvens]SKA66199.1 hypothetical protein SAMN02745213_01774 [Succinivibrio dextrinosolvens DSM 3072]
MKYLLCFISLTFLFLSSTSYARSSDLSKYVGYSIVYSGTITGFVDDSLRPNGKFNKNGAFEGCEFGRKIIIDYQYAVTCEDYDYTYSFMPQVTIISNGRDAKMIVENQVFNIRLK